jgi:hypothetical protein
MLGGRKTRGQRNGELVKGMNEECKKEGKQEWGERKAELVKG